MVVKRLRIGREAYCHDERILGSSTFVESVKLEASRAVPAVSSRLSNGMTLPDLLERVCRGLRIDPAVLRPGELSKRSCLAREAVAFLWVAVLGRRSHELALTLGTHDKSIFRLARRGRKNAEAWLRVLDREADS